MTISAVFWWQTRFILPRNSYSRRGSLSCNITSIHAPQILKTIFLPTPCLTKPIDRSGTGCCYTASLEMMLRNRQKFTNSLKDPSWSGSALINLPISCKTLREMMSTKGWRRQWPYWSCAGVGVTDAPYATFSFPLHPRTSSKDNTCRHCSPFVRGRGVKKTGGFRPVWRRR